MKYIILTLAVTVVILFVLIYHLPQHEFSDIQADYNSVFVGSVFELDRELSNYYKIKSNKVYYHGRCAALEPCGDLLVGVHPAQFEPIAKSWARVHQDEQVFLYYRDKRLNNHGIFDLTNLTPINDFYNSRNYFTDGKALYRLRYSTPGDNPDKFADEFTLPILIDFETNITLFDEEADVIFVDEKVYMNGTLLAMADAKTFKKIPTPSGSPIPGGPWYVDKDYVYLSQYVVRGADPKTFTLVAPTSADAQPFDPSKDNYIHVAKDKDSVYYAPFNRLTVDSGINVTEHSKECKDIFDCEIDIVVPNVNPDGLYYIDYVGDSAVEDKMTFFTNEGEFTFKGETVVQ